MICYPSHLIVRNIGSGNIVKQPKVTPPPQTQKLKVACYYEADILYCTLDGKLGTHWPCLS